LKPATKQWWNAVVRTYVLEPHHLRLLTLAAEAWDRGQEARLTLVKKGLTYLDRFGQPRTQPEVAIERDSRVAFARLLRELCLDIEPPPDSRVARRAGTGR
jgi:hypothetical protein